MSEPWLGHRDLCPIQWGEPCDCDGREIDLLKVLDQMDDGEDEE